MVVLYVGDGRVSMSAFATVCCVVAGLWLISSDKLKKSKIRPIKLSSVVYVLILLNLIVFGVAIGFYLGLDRADRVDIALGTALGAAFGAVTDSLHQAIYEATENYSLAKLPYPLLMLAIAPEVIITPFQDETGSYRHGLLAYIAGFVVSVVMAEVSRRRTSNSASRSDHAEPLRIGRVDTLITLVIALLAVHFSLDLLSLSQAEQNHFVGFFGMGMALGFVAENAGFRIGSPAVALVTSVILALAATSGLGRLIIPGSDAKASRAVELVGLIVGVMLATLSERGFFAQLRRPISPDSSD